MLCAPFHEFYKVIEKVSRIVRTGRRLRVVLYAKHGIIPMPESFERFVVEIRVRDLDFVQVQRIGIHREAVIMRRDLDFPGDFVQHRMIRAAMAEFQFVRFPADRDSEHLVPKADSEDRRLADQLADLRGLMLERFRIAWAVR